MGPLDRIRNTFLVRKILGPRERSVRAVPAAAAESAPADPAPGSDVVSDADAVFGSGLGPPEDVAPDSGGPGPDEDADEDAGGEPSAEGGGRTGLTGWVERRAHRVVSKIYDSRADDLETRARRAVGSAYADQADDLEDRAVRAMRRAITTEADRIKDVIEHSVQVKKREVRLSLLVLVTASLVYLTLYWFTSRPTS